MVYEVSYELLGKIFVAALLIIAAVFAMGLSLAYIVFKKKKLIFPKFILFVLDSFHAMSKKAVSLLGGNEFMIEIVGIEIRNKLSKNKFAKTPYSERIIILPQCLRKLECPAKMSSVDGLKCIGCGQCKVAKIAKKAKELGYKDTIVVPGGGFIKRIIKKYKPEAILGVACPHEVHGGMAQLAKTGVVLQGIILKYGGCVETKVDLRELYGMMSLSSSPD
ncbi:hypothetical protein BEH94_02095 [Candidatus Altiarchaeales archaeon WOR_SM1_SCG]|nr:hypothetical protein BEH94_02095 [Candidatus Altiarchaeales archaeon WOR_SM1_SCG]